MTLIILMKNSKFIKIKDDLHQTKNKSNEY